MGKWLVSLILSGVACLTPGAAADNAPTPLTPFLGPVSLEESQLQKIDQTLERAMATGDFVGLAVAVVRDGETKFLKTYGVTEIDGGAAVTPNTLFRIASLSKGFASSLAGLAVEEGKLSLDAPAIDFAPDLKLAGGAEKALTLAELLSHRTGLPPNAYDNLLEAGIAPAKILPRYRKVKPICRVGDCYAYQNVVYDIAGLALAETYHEPYAELVETRLFAPLGMKTASIGFDALTASADWARPHKRDRRKSEDAAPNPWHEIEVKKPYYDIPAAGGVNASISDMAQWLKAQLGDRPDVLDATVLDLIHAPQVPTRSETRRMRRVMENLNASQYGLGWRVYDYGGKTVIAHGGSVDGYGAQIAFIPELDAGIVVLANARTKRMWSIAPMFLDLTLGLPQKDWLALEETTGGGAAGLQ
ncbi:serine hydrolase domain-containing protein [Hyphococcus luteus]|uniref:Serine hydrolase n=1 Tax=Hyphococcus luteus TaxID=2058213 RepID=A0A2S7JYY2_9PROT|nr:serine hydrolase domain-containing protein [Marinicaulis flavus]PQA85463.1 serine hydrolase [Marinicaulis flavus]